MDKRNLPHTLYTRVGAVNLYRYTCDIAFVLRRYHISKASLMRWNRQFDDTMESLNVSENIITMHFLSKMFSIWIHATFCSWSDAFFLSFRCIFGGRSGLQCTSCT